MNALRGLASLLVIYTCVYGLCGERLGWRSTGRDALIYFVGAIAVSINPHGVLPIFIYIWWFVAGGYVKQWIDRETPRRV